LSLCPVVVRPTWIQDFEIFMMLIETRVQPSGIHGMGLFAVRLIPRATPIWTFQPGFDHDFSPAQFAALPALAREHTRWFCFVSKSDGHVILSGDHACFINHSTNPNTGAPPSATPPVVTVALCDIAPGEEITCNYFDYDADTRWKLGLVPKNAPLGA
jgi:SET domain-containing protein